VIREQPLDRVQLAFQIGSHVRRRFATRSLAVQLALDAREVGRERKPADPGTAKVRGHLPAARRLMPMVVETRKVQRLVGPVLERVTQRALALASGERGRFGETTFEGVRDVGRIDDELAGDVEVRAFVDFARKELGRDRFLLVPANTLKERASAAPAAAP